MHKAENIICITLCLILAIVFAVATFLNIDASESKGISYGETEKKTYTFVSLHNTDTGTFITVEEEEDPVIITSISLNKADRDALAALAHGDVIECDVLPTQVPGASCEVAEIRKGEATLLSLDGYNAAHKENAGIGVIIAPVLSLLSLALAVAFIYAYKHNKSLLANLRRYG